MKPTVAIVQGDPSGIGPELLAKLLCCEDIRQRANIVVLGDERVFEAGCAVAALEPPVVRCRELAAGAFDAGLPVLVDIPSLDPADVPLASVSGLAGKAVLEWLARALDLAREGHVGGVCFMPFNKAAMGMGGLDHEDEAQWARAYLGCTGLVSEFNVVDRMWNGRVTSHIPLREVADQLSLERILATIELADRTLRAAGVERPRIAVAALNPHAGDSGKIGREEIDVIAPAVAAARERQIAAHGPLPADTLYLKVRDGEYDCAVTMYHDQGQIAIKLLGFDRGVSVLAGLPVPLTTPAHGTAFDIVGRNIANVEPSRRAFLMVARMAEDLCAQRERASSRSTS